MVLDNTNLSNTSILRHITSYVQYVMGLMHEGIHFFETHNTAAIIMLTFLQTSL